MAMVGTSASVSSIRRTTQAGPPRLITALARLVEMISRRRRWNCGLAAIARGAPAVFQWWAETLLKHPDSKSPDAEWLTSPRLMMPTIRLLLLITGSLGSFNFSLG